MGQSTHDAQSCVGGCFSLSVLWIFFYNRQPPKLQNQMKEQWEGGEGAGNSLSFSLSPFSCNKSLPLSYEGTNICIFSLAEPKNPHLRLCSSKEGKKRYILRTMCSSALWNNMIFVCTVLKIAPICGESSSRFKENSEKCKFLTDHCVSFFV